MNVYNAQNCTFVEKQEIAKQYVQEMHVHSQKVGKCDDDKDFDIDSFPARYFNWIRGVNDKSRKEEIMKMRQEMEEEAERYDDISRHKSEILSAVFEPRIQKDKIKSIPSHTVLLELFGDCIDGIAKKAHNDWKSDLEWRFWHKKSKKRS